MSVEDTVLGMWKALSARDWESLKTFLSDDCIYLDMPVGPAAAARGPDDIVKRLKIGLEPLASYENFSGLMVDNGIDVMYEHHEEWHWATGESATLEVRHRAPRGERQDHAVEGLLGYGSAGQSRPAHLDGRLRERRHVLGVRRDRIDLRARDGERGRRGVYPGVFEVTPATERSCATSHTAKAVSGSREPHSVRGSRPRVAGWPESRPELGDWRLDNSVPDRGSGPWVGL